MHLIQRRRRREQRRGHAYEQVLGLFVALAVSFSKSDRGGDHEIEHAPVRGKLLDQCDYFSSGAVIVHAIDSAARNARLCLQIRNTSYPIATPKPVARGRPIT